MYLFLVPFLVLFITNKPARYSDEEISYLNDPDKPVCPRLNLSVEEITSIAMTIANVIHSKAPYIIINISEEVVRSVLGRLGPDWEDDDNGLIGAGRGKPTR